MEQIIIDRLQNLFKTSFTESENEWACFSPSHLYDCILLFDSGEAGQVWTHGQPRTQTPFAKTLTDTGSGATVIGWLKYIGALTGARSLITSGQNDYYKGQDLNQSLRRKAAIMIMSVK